MQAATGTLVDERGDKIAHALSLRGGSGSPLAPAGGGSSTEDKQEEQDREQEGQDREHEAGWDEQEEQLAARAEAEAKVRAAEQVGSRSNSLAQTSLDLLHPNLPQSRAIELRFSGGAGVAGGAGEGTGGGRLRGGGGT